MDFFEYAEFASVFVTNGSKLWVTYLVGGLCFAVVYIFQAIALLTISRREGYANSWMAFVPFLNTYYIGVCGQKNRAFRTVSTKKLAIACAALEGVLFTGYLIYNIAVAKLAAAECLEYVPDELLTGMYTVYLKSTIPSELLWAAWCYKFLYDYILVWLNLVYLFLEVLVLSAFFQTYAARRYFLFTLTSVFFPIQGILFFAVRNNRGMNYREYMYREQERQYNMYRQYQRSNPYQNPYQSSYNNPYSKNQSNPNPQTPPDDPFGDMGGGNGNNNNTDPFS